MKLSDSEMSSIMLNQILVNEQYSRLVLPYLDENLFLDYTEKRIFNEIYNYNMIYNKSPSPRELVATLKESSDGITGLDKGVLEQSLKKLDFEVNDEWLYDLTEKHIKRIRVTKAFEKALGGFEKGDNVDAIPNLFEEAINFNFDTSIGHDYMNDVESRYEHYTTPINKLPIGLKIFDKITQGGFEKGTINVVLAGSGVGKTMFMIDRATYWATQGKKVLCISLEMGEFKLGERIDSNLLDMPISSLKNISKDEYLRKFKNGTSDIRKNGGEIYFKQFPTSSANAGHFRNLINEFRNKKGVEFDVIVVDYINICDAIRSDSNRSYHVQNITEELRALAIMEDVVILTATQTVKDDQDASDASMKSIGESHGIAKTADFIMFMNKIEEKVMIKQIKSRYGDTDYYNKFFIGQDKGRMRFYDLDDSSNVIKKETKKDDNVDLTKALMYGGSDDGLDTSKLIL